LGAVDRWVRGAFFGIFLALGFFRFDGESRPTHLPLTQAVSQHEGFEKDVLQMVSRRSQVSPALLAIRFCLQQVQRKFCKSDFVTGW
jgi:hypothetical protein